MWYNKYIKERKEVITMKFYGIMFEGWHGHSDDLNELLDVFYNEEDCENEIDRLNGGCSPEEEYYMVELNEEQVKKYWGDTEIS